MAMDNRTLAVEYIEAVGNKQFDRLPAFFHPDLEFSGPGVARPTHTAQDLIDGLRRLTLILRRNDIKRVFVDGDEACVIYDFVTDTPVGAVPSVEWLTLEAGKIRSIVLIFDRHRWPEVQEELARRVSSGASYPK